MSAWLDLVLLALCLVGTAIFSGSETAFYREAKRIDAVAEGFAAAEKSVRSTAVNPRNAGASIPVRLKKTWPRTRWLAAAALLIVTVGAAFIWNWKTSAPSSAIVSPARSAAFPSPTMDATFSVPARRPLSCDPPMSDERNRAPVFI